MPLYLLLPCGAAVLYSLGSIFMKRSLVEGARTFQTFHVTNLMVGLVFSPLILLQKGEIAWNELHHPLLAASAFFLGNWFTFIAIQRGDVSLVTPLMGTKVVFVAIFVLLLTGAAPSSLLWVAAILTAAGIFLMGLKDFLKGGYHPLQTIFFALLSSATFGLSDVFVRKWAPSFGPMAFLTISSLVVAAFSLMVLPFQKRKTGLPVLPEKGPRKWLLLGSFLIAFQAVMIGLSLAFFADPTGINVVYSSRGMWAIVLVVLLGPWLGNWERRTARAALVWRFTGAMLLMIAIVLAVLNQTSGPPPS